jgi:hypothetical protein
MSKFYEGYGKIGTIPTRRDFRRAARARKR